MQRGARQRVRIAFYEAVYLCAVGQLAGSGKVGVVCRRRPVVGRLVPHGRVKLHVFGRLLVLFLQLILGYGVDEARAYDADSRLEAHLYVVGLRVSVERLLVDCYLGIYQAVLLAVGELLRRQSARHRSLHRMPSKVYAIFVNRRQERRHGLRLRHTCHLAYERSVVAARAVGMVDDEQVSVAESRRTVLLLTLAVAVTGVAVDARIAHRGRAEAVEWGRVERDVALEEHLAEVELVHEPLVGNGRSLVFIASGGDVLGGSQLSAGIPFVGREVAYGLAHIRVVVGRSVAAAVVVVVGTGRH